MVTADCASAELRMTRQLTACRILEATADCTVAKKRQ